MDDDAVRAIADAAVDEVPPGGAVEMVDGKRRLIVTKNPPDTVAVYEKAVARVVGVAMREDRRAAGPGGELGVRDLMSEVWACVKGLKVSGDDFACFVAREGRTRKFRIAAYADPDFMAGTFGLPTKKLWSAIRDAIHAGGDPTGWSRCECNKGRQLLRAVSDEDSMHDGEGAGPDGGAAAGGAGGPDPVVVGCGEGLNLTDRKPKLSHIFPDDRPAAFHPDGCGVCILPCVAGRSGNVCLQCARVAAAGKAVKLRGGKKTAGAKRRFVEVDMDDALSRIASLEESNSDLQARVAALESLSQKSSGATDVVGSATAVGGEGAAVDKPLSAIVVGLGAATAHGSAPLAGEPMKRDSGSGDNTVNAATSYVTLAANKMDTTKPGGADGAAGDGSDGGGDAGGEGDEVEEEDGDDANPDNGDKERDGGDSGDSDSGSDDDDADDTAVILTVMMVTLLRIVRAAAADGGRNTLEPFPTTATDRETEAEAVMRSVDDDTLVIAFMGPSGVYKSTLISRFILFLMEYQTPEMQAALRRAIDTGTLTVGTGSSHTNESDTRGAVVLNVRLRLPPTRESGPKYVVIIDCQGSEVSGDDHGTERETSDIYSAVTSICSAVVQPNNDASRVPLATGSGALGRATAYVRQALAIDKAVRADGTLPVREHRPSLFIVANDHADPAAFDDDDDGRLARLLDVTGRLRGILGWVDDGDDAAGGRAGADEAFRISDADREACQPLREAYAAIHAVAMPAATQAPPRIDGEDADAGAMYEVDDYLRKFRAIDDATSWYRRAEHVLVRKVISNSTPAQFTVETGGAGGAAHVDSREVTVSYFRGVVATINARDDADRIDVSLFQTHVVWARTICERGLHDACDAYDAQMRDVSDAAVAVAAASTEVAATGRSVGDLAADVERLRAADVAARAAAVAAALEVWREVVHKLPTRVGEPRYVVAEEVGEAGSEAAAAAAAADGAVVVLPPVGDVAVGRRDNPAATVEQYAFLLVEGLAVRRKRYELAIAEAASALARSTCAAIGRIRSDDRASRDEAMARANEERKRSDAILAQKRAELAAAAEAYKRKLSTWEKIMREIRRP
eukprot:CAMPEP_0203811554 /NCGR_PEP_ID=MMETSP0115-20131106/3628_1 /ASSEMBLY_ACC=CAM_ASM_000227 /TAXON_ID=33651 /ORGANISM="Bicosoecid sp, Strain ms1" /LENGTH=1082 /DNA_ID=CAMNT_0050720379 /DNA_START=97 /DNA_END=3342 /DNA_ORIENTATION=+